MFIERKLSQEIVGGQHDRSKLIKERLCMSGSGNLQINLDLSIVQRFTLINIDLSRTTFDWG